MQYDRQLQQQLDHEHSDYAQQKHGHQLDDIQGIQDLKIKDEKARRVLARRILAHEIETNNPHKVTAEQVGKDQPIWNANRLNGIEIDTTFQRDGFAPVYSEKSGKLEFYPLTNEKFFDHNKLTNFEESKHSELNDKEISKKKIWSSAKTSQEIAKKADLKHFHPKLIKDIEKNQSEIVKTNENIAKIRADIGLVDGKISKIDYAKSEHKHNDLNDLIKTKADKKSIEKDITNISKELDKKALKSDIELVRSEIPQIPKDLIKFKDLSTALSTKADKIHEHKDYAIADIVDKKLDKKLEKKDLPDLAGLATKEDLRLESMSLANLNHRHKTRDIIGLDQAISDGSLKSFETVCKNLKAYNASYTYTDGLITSIDYDLGGGQTITKTINYTDGVPTSIVLSGDIPSGIQTTKTIVWDSNLIVSTSYA